MRGSRPSSILARHLFADEANEIPRSADVAAEEYPDAERRLRTLEEHRSVLREAFVEARREIVVVSPQLGN